MNLIYELKYEKASIWRAIWNTVYRIYDLVATVYVLALLTGIIFGLAV